MHTWVLVAFQARWFQCWEITFFPLPFFFFSSVRKRCEWAVETKTCCRSWESREKGFWKANAKWRHSMAFATEPCSLQWGSPGNQGTGAGITNHSTEINTARGSVETNSKFFSDSVVWARPTTTLLERQGGVWTVLGDMGFSKSWKQLNFYKHTRRKIRLVTESRTKSWAF